MIIYISYDIFYSTGDFINHGGAGGKNAEPGGPGTVYLHKLPELTETGSIPADFNENRTLYLNNKGYEPRNPLRNLTDTYPDYATASGVSWLWPGSYPPSVFVASPDIDEKEDIIVDYLKVCLSQM